MHTIARVTGASSFSCERMAASELNMGVVEQINLQETLGSPALAAEMVGRSFPLGATLVAGGVNFTLFSRGASGVELLLFDREDDARPSRRVIIDSAESRS